VGEMKLNPTQNGKAPKLEEYIPMMFNFWACGLCKFHLDEEENPALLMLGRQTIKR